MGLIIQESFGGAGVHPIAVAKFTWKPTYSALFKYNRFCLGVRKIAFIFWVNTGIATGKTSENFKREKVQEI